MKCKLCGERPAAVPDRNTLSSRKAVCRECHAGRLRGDLAVLTRTEIDHVLYLVHLNGEAGDYYGNPREYWRRHNSIVKKLEAALYRQSPDIVQANESP